MRDERHAVRGKRRESEKEDRWDRPHGRWPVLDHTPELSRQ